MPKPKPFRKSRNPCRIDLATQPEFADFLQFLVPLFGTKLRALCFLLERTEAFQAWRSKVVWCSICKAHVPFYVTTKKSGGVTVCRYEIHVHPNTLKQNRPVRCRNSSQPFTVSLDRNLIVDADSRSIASASLVQSIKAAHPDPITGLL